MKIISEKQQQPNNIFNKQPKHLIFNYQEESAASELCGSGSGPPGTPVCGALRDRNPLFFTEDRDEKEGR